MSWPTWHLQRGSNLPKTFRWVDCDGPVNMADMDLHVRLVSWDGGVLELTSDDPSVVIAEQPTAAGYGFFTITLSEEQREQIRMEAAGHYYFTALYHGLKHPFADGPLIVELNGAGQGHHLELFGEGNSAIWSLTQAERRAAEEAAALALQYSGLGDLVVTGNLTITDAHRGLLLLVDSTEDVEIRVPAGLEAPFRIEVAQIGLGMVEFDWSAVTLVGAELGRELIAPVGRGSVVFIRSYAQDVYLIAGDPSGGAGPGPGVPSYLTTETGDRLVTETGDYLILEA